MIEQTISANPASTHEGAQDGLGPDDFDALDAMLDDLRTRSEEVPQWEFCEGFLAALSVSRRAIAPEEYFPLLLDWEVGAEAGAPSAAAGPAPGLFADDAQQARFLQLWEQRRTEIQVALAVEVQSLDDARAYHPEVVDVRGAVASLPEAERTEMAGEHLPSFAQVWALGFMYVVENWPQEWTPPRDKQARKVLDEALQCIVALTEDDTDEPTISVFSEEGAPSVSTRRFNAFADAVWAVYDLHDLWRSIGPRVETAQRTTEPGRNDPCHCGSGKKYKKCHGA